MKRPTRDIRLMGRFYPAEADTIQRNAARFGMTVSDYLRQAAIHYAAAMTDQEALPTLAEIVQRMREVQS
jgi:uncharacterized protein (DUF1778 family)